MNTAPSWPWRLSHSAHVRHGVGRASPRSSSGPGETHPAGAVERRSAEVPDHGVQPAAGCVDHPHGLGHVDWLNGCRCAQKCSGFCQVDNGFLELRPVAFVLAQRLDDSRVAIQGVDQPDNGVCSA